MCVGFFKGTDQSVVGMPSVICVSVVGCEVVFYMGVLWWFRI